MNKDEFVIPAFLNKDKSSKVKAVNIENDERIKEVMEGDCVDSGVDPGLDPDEVIFVEGEDDFVKEAMTTSTDELLKDGKWHEIPTMTSYSEPMIFHEEPVKKNTVSEAQLKDVARMARALRPEEIRTVLDNIPVNYIYDKIGQVLETNRKFNEAIMKATDIIKD